MDQIFAWVVFIGFLFIAMVRAYRFPTLKSKRYDPMRWMLWAILFSALMLTWRACFRCAEAATGRSLQVHSSRAPLTGQATSMGPLPMNRCLLVSNTSPLSSLLVCGLSYLRVDLSRTSCQVGKRELKGSKAKTSRN
jgi:hypothetical protein